MQPLKPDCSEKTAQFYPRRIPLRRQPHWSASMIEAMVKMQGMRQIEYIVDSTYFLGFDCTGFDCGGRGTVCPFSICSRSGFGFALGSGFLFGAGILDLSLILFSGKRSLRK